MKLLNISLYGHWARDGYYLAGAENYFYECIKLIKLKRITYAIQTGGWSLKY